MIRFGLVFIFLSTGLVTCNAQLSPQGLKEDQKYAELAADADKNFRESVSPFVKKYCIECHQNKRPTEAGVNFSPAIQKPGDAAFTQQWKKSIARVKAHDMPPAHANHQPSEDERKTFVEGVAKLKFLSPKDPGLFVIRRLTKTEYGNTLRDLLGVDRSIADALPDEVSGAGYLNSLTPIQMELYLGMAKRAVEQLKVSTNPRSVQLRDQFFQSENISEKETIGVAESAARGLAKKVYRRPPSQQEVDVLLSVYHLGIKNELSHRASLQLMLEAMLVSPQFLFITPAESIDPGSRIVRVDDFQLASRLSYLIWGTMPDEELTSLAEARKLHELDILQQQTTRLLMDPRSRALFDGFGAQWLGMTDLRTKTFDTTKYPQVTDELRSAMYDEARLFFECVVRENRSVADFIDSDFTFLNSSLASIYGIELPLDIQKMQRWQLNPSDRGGLLGMPGVLAATSFPNRTSPVKRGVWVLEQLLGEHVPSPPPEVPNLEDQEKEKIANLTLRQRTELHRTQAVCANCHAILDPIGFGLENFDAIGRWRDHDDTGGRIDATGELPSGERFASPRELKAILASRKEDIARNLAKKLLAYALCRNLEGYDEVVVDAIVESIATDGYRMQSLIRELVVSYPFTYRRIQLPNKPTASSE